MSAIDHGPTLNISRTPVCTVCQDGDRSHWRPCQGPWSLVKPGAGGASVNLVPRFAHACVNQKPEPELWMAWIKHGSGYIKLPSTSWWTNVLEDVDLYSSELQRQKSALVWQDATHVLEVSGYRVRRVLQGFCTVKDGESLWSAAQSRYSRQLDTPLMSTGQHRDWSIMSPRGRQDPLPRQLRTRWDRKEWGVSGAEPSISDLRDQSGDPAVVLRNAMLQVEVTAPHMVQQFVVFDHAHKELMTN
ncbi:hypothetical protein Bbelb_315710 [Branchiostoma belcheri]|nr:hypothetical protein Bbelb_315710 [Branchiostoma belcheri]